MRRPHLPDLLRCGTRMNDTFPAPGKNSFLRNLFGHIGCQIPIRYKQDFLFRNRLHHPNRIGRGTADVAFRLHRRTGVDIAHRCCVRMLCPGPAQLLCRNGLRQRTACIFCRKKNGFLWGENFGALCHKVNPAKDNNVLPQVRSLLAESKGIPHQIRNFLYFRRLIVMSQHNSIPLAFERFNSVHK